MKKETVVVALSGGVDSAVAAALLQQQGYQVIGLIMKNWQEDQDGPCPYEQDVADAQAVCDTLGIQLHKVNFAAEYWQQVFTDFLHSLERGLTPNPDILCNREIKFKSFWQAAKELGADRMATGHYVRKAQYNGHWQLKTGCDTSKDQSYFLYTLTQDQIEHSLFPVGELPKSQVRDIAAKLGLINHAKKDSTGICFIGERPFNRFISQYLSAEPGDIVTTDGMNIGKHQGLIYYTRGQRKGLNIGGIAAYPNAAWYVVDKDQTQNRLIVAPHREHPRLYQSHLTATEVHFIAEPPVFPLHCTAKTRYRQPASPCVAKLESSGHWHVTFAEPQWAMTPGQSVVFYENETCLGGGLISEVN